MKFITDEIDLYIRAILRNQDDFIPTSIRYSLLQQNDGILIAVGRLNTQESVDDAIHSVLFSKEKHTIDDAKEWMRANKGTIWDAQEVEFSNFIEATTEMNYQPKGETIEMSMKTIQSVPIFKVGTHNGQKFNQDDLNQMVQNFTVLKGENPDFQIPIKIGHDKALDTEKPAIGWMENLRISGDMIVADFVDLSQDAFDLIKSKQFKNRSIEIFTQFVTSAGKKIGKVIKGIALLGSSLPAVNLPDIRFKTLSDSILAFGKDQKWTGFEVAIAEPEQSVKAVDGEPNSQKQNERKEESIMSEEKDIKDAEKSTEEPTAEPEAKAEGVEEKEESKKEAETVEASAKPQADELAFLKEFSNADEVVEKLKQAKEMEAKLAEFESKAKQEKEDAHKQSITEFASTLVKENRILPKEKEVVEGLLFSINEEQETELVFEHGQKKMVNVLSQFKEFLSQLPDRGLLKEHSKVGSKRPESKEGFDKALLEFASKKGLSEVQFKSLSIAEHKSLLEEFESSFK